MRDGCTTDDQGRAGGGGDGGARRCAAGRAGRRRRDPATPHRGGEITREAFGDRARLVSVDSGGHGVYVYDDNPCALNTTTRFLLDGNLPESDVFCGASTASGLALDDAGQRERAETLVRLNRGPGSAWR